MIATKVYGGRDPWPNTSRLSALHIRQACDDSLRRLQTDHIDLYQMHHIDRDTPWEEIWQAMDLLVQQGKVLYVGSSNFAGWQIVQANEAAKARGSLGLVAEQSLYNLNARTVELEVLPACQAYGLGVIPWSPLGGGLLGGALRKITEGRRASERVQSAIEANRDKLEAWEAFCGELGQDPADVALAWLLHQPAVTAPIIGPRTTDQFTGALAALEIELEQSTSTLDKIFPAPAAPPPRPTPGNRRVGRWTTRPTAPVTRGAIGHRSTGTRRCSSAPPARSGAGAVAGRIPGLRAAVATCCTRCRRDHGLVRGDTLAHDVVVQPWMDRGGVGARVVLIAWYGAFHLRLGRAPCPRRHASVNAKWPSLSERFTGEPRERALDAGQRLPIWTACEVVTLWLFSSGRIPWARVGRTSGVVRRADGADPALSGTASARAVWSDLVPARDRGGFDAVGGAELAQDVGDVHAGGLPADEQLLTDLAIGSAVDHQAQHLELTPSEPERRLEPSPHRRRRSRSRRPVAAGLDARGRRHRGGGARPGGGRRS